MNKIMKSLRCEMFVNNKHGIISALQKKPLQKNKCAEMAYQFVQAGLRAGEVCGLYNISSSYYRELKAVKGGEWAALMLTADEVFTEFLTTSSTVGHDAGMSEIDYYKWLGCFMGAYIVHGEFQDSTVEDTLYLFKECYKSTQDQPEQASAYTEITP